MKPEFSDLAIDTKADALLALLNDQGQILILSGERCLTAEEPYDPSTLLARVDLANPAFGPSVGGEATMEPVQPAPGLADGKPTWCRFVTRLGQALFDGDIPEHMDLGKEDVQQDGEVWVEAFTYVESKR